MEQSAVTQNIFRNVSVFSTGTCKCMSQHTKNVTCMLTAFLSSWKWSLTSFRSLDKILKLSEKECLLPTKKHQKKKLLLYYQDCFVLYLSQLTAKHKWRAHTPLHAQNLNTNTVGESRHSLFAIYMKLITNSDIEEIIRHMVNWRHNSIIL